MKKTIEDLENKLKELVKEYVKGKTRIFLSKSKKEARLNQSLSDKLTLQMEKVERKINYLKKSQISS